MIERSLLKNFMDECQQCLNIDYKKTVSDDIFLLKNGEAKLYLVLKTPIQFQMEAAQKEQLKIVEDLQSIGHQNHILILPFFSKFEYNQFAKHLQLSEKQIQKLKTIKNSKKFRLLSEIDFSLKPIDFNFSGLRYFIKYLYFHTKPRKEDENSIKCYRDYFFKSINRVYGNYTIMFPKEIIQIERVILGIKAVYPIYEILQYIHKETNRNR